MNRFHFILLLVLFAACTKKKAGKCTLTCGTPGATALFKGYAADETDSVYLRTYAIGGSFGQVLSTKLYTDLQPIFFAGTSLSGTGSILLFSENDYEVVVPATGQTFRIAMKDTTVVDTFMCDDMPKGGCKAGFAGASVTGGPNSGYATGPSAVYLVLER